MRVEGSLDKIGNSIDKVMNKLDERSRTPWAVLVSTGILMLGVLGVIGAAWKAPIDNIVARQELDIRSLQEGIVPRVEHDGKWSAQLRETDDMRRRLDRLEDHAFSP